MPDLVLLLIAWLLPEGASGHAAEHEQQGS
jgi:hypothetical protein